MTPIYSLGAPQPRGAGRSPAVSGPHRDCAQTHSRGRLRHIARRDARLLERWASRAEVVPPRRRASNQGKSSLIKANQAKK